MTTSQKAYIALVKRPIGFLGALVENIVLYIILWSINL